MKRQHSIADFFSKSPKTDGKENSEQTNFVSGSASEIFRMQVNISKQATSSEYLTLQKETCDKTSENANLQDKEYEIV